LSTKNEKSTELKCDWAICFDNKVAARRSDFGDIGGADSTGVGTVVSHGLGEEIRLEKATDIGGL
jgi:hypothetical protein